MKRKIFSIFVLTLIVFGGEAIFMASENNNTYYATGGNYNSGSSLTIYGNNKYQVDAHVGFDYGATPNGGDYNRACYTTYKKSDDVATTVKDLNGKTASGSRSHESCAKIGALRGTDYHKFSV